MKFVERQNKRNLAKTEFVTKVSKRRRKPVKKKYTVKQILFFLNLRLYPIVLNESFKKSFCNEKMFENYYLPLLYLFNSNECLLVLKMLCKAFYEEFVAV